MRIGDKIRLLRDAAGISQKELAERVGKSQAIIAQYESGARRFQEEMLEPIADALGVEPGLFYERPLWGRIDEAQAEVNKAMAEVQTILKSARDTVPASTNESKRSATHVAGTGPTETHDFCSQDRNGAPLLALSR